MLASIYSFCCITRPGASSKLKRRIASATARFYEEIATRGAGSLGDKLYLRRDAGAVERTRLENVQG